MAEQDQVFAKCAWRLIPFMGLLFVVNYIDRTNAGFAALTMNRDLGFSPSAYGFGAGVFFLSYALFQVPANMVLERIGARHWVFCIMSAWGLLAALNAAVKTPVGFYLVRFLLGIAEAGFFPGMLLYLTYWFPRSHLSRFTAYFIAALPLSFVVGGPLSSLILRMDGMAGLHGWQWLYLMEGLPASALAFAVLKVLPDGPAQAAWLTDTQKETIAARLAAEIPAGRPDLWGALRDLRLLALCLGAVMTYAAAYSIYLWLPQIVHAMGFSNTATGFVIALCYVLAIPAMIMVGRSSSRRGERTWHVALPCLVAATSFGVASVTHSNAVTLVALAVALIANFSCLGPYYTFPASFLRGAAVAAGIGLVGTFGNIGGFLGPVVTGLLVEASGNYRTGFAASGIGWALAALIIIAVGRALAAPEPPIEIAKA
jgi:ACS family tartrate transporter-like MFS transporter